MTDVKLPETILDILHLVCSEWEIGGYLVYVLLHPYERILVKKIMYYC